MSYNIVHCSIDEHGKISGGTPGDQTKKECCVRSYYVKSGGWDVVIRHPSIKVAKHACDIANKLAISNLVGYNQYKRMSLYKALKKNNWDVDKFINSGEKVDADCSSFLYAVWCCVLPELRGEVNAPCTSTYRQFYSKHGFKCYTDSKYTCSGDYLLPGDMINKSSSHVVMFTSTGSKTSKSKSNYKSNGVASCNPNLKFGSKGEQVKLLQDNLNKVIGAGLTIDGEFGKNTEEALKAFQKKYGLEVDGIYGSLSRAKMIELY